MGSASNDKDLSEALLLEKHRVESFKSWPFDDASSCNKLKMAEAGFYWTGTDREPDTATCFVCNKTLDGWENTDDPWKEHAKHAPQCAFVKYGRSENEISLRQYLDIFHIVIRNRIVRQLEIAKIDIQQHAQQQLETFSGKKN